MEHIIYFLNHLAAQDVSPHQRGINALIFTGIPALLSLVIMLGLMRWVRGNKIKLISSIILLYLLCTIIPFLIMLHSLLFLQLSDQILSLFFLYLIFAVFYTAVVSECYSRYRYKTDARI